MLYNVLSAAAAHSPAFGLALAQNRSNPFRQCVSVWCLGHGASLAVKNDFLRGRKSALSIAGKSNARCPASHGFKVYLPERLGCGGQNTDAGHSIESGKHLVMGSGKYQTIAQTYLAGVVLESRHFRSGTDENQFGGRLQQAHCIHQHRNMLGAGQAPNVEYNRLVQTQIVVPFDAVEIAAPILRGEDLGIDSGRDDMACASVRWKVAKQLTAHVLAESDGGALTGQLPLQSGGNQIAKRPQSEQHESTFRWKTMRLKVEPAAVHLRVCAKYVDQGSSVATAQNPQTDGNGTGPNCVGSELVQYRRDGPLHGSYYFAQPRVWPTPGDAGGSNDFDTLMLHTQGLIRRSLQAEYLDLMASAEQLGTDIAKRVFHTSNCGIRRPVD